MRFTYRLVPDGSGFVAECVENEAAGEGRTEREAIDSLRTTLRERLIRPDAVAPPSNPVPEPEIELVRAKLEAVSEV